MHECKIVRKLCGADIGTVHIEEKWEGDLIRTLNKRSRGYLLINCRYDYAKSLIHRGEQN